MVVTAGFPSNGVFDQKLGLSVPNGRPLPDVSVKCPLSLDKTEGNRTI
jgi:hypothetical protein